MSYWGVYGLGANGLVALERGLGRHSKARTGNRNAPLGR
jgi:hypothetical protein